MHPILRNLLAVILGLIVGGFVNMGIITLGASIIPPSEGIDNTSMEELIASIHLFQPKHFIFPFIAHSLGTFAGAFLTALIATSYQLKLALVIGFFFLAGGTYMVLALPSPIWFTILDLVGAYIPMAYFGGRLALATKQIITQRN